VIVTSSEVGALTWFYGQKPWLADGDLPDIIQVRQIWEGMPQSRIPYNHSDITDLSCSKFPKVQSDGGLQRVYSCDILASRRSYIVTGARKAPLTEQCLVNRQDVARIDSDGANKN
jgi:hypothetical protein